MLWVSLGRPRVSRDMYHIPVLLGQSVDGLSVKSSGIYVDVTFGGGGHSELILSKLDTGKLYAFDQDEDAWENAIDSPCFELIQSNFRFLKRQLKIRGVDKVDGLLADLGVSSHQFDALERGFSIHENYDLDMRMGKTVSKTAKQVVNEYDESDLVHIFSMYGEIKNSKTVARAIVKARSENLISTTDELKEAVVSATPKFGEFKFWAKLFQAIRIEVNEEMKVLEELLEQCEEMLAPGGRLVVISYHSLEDRMVKKFIKKGNFKGTVEKDFYGNILRPFDEVVRGVIVPGEDEIERNSRARSAKMRIAVRRNG